MQSHKKMKCRHIQKRLSAYQDGELRADEKDRVKAHLMDCPECTKLYERFVHTWDALGDAPHIQPGPEFNLQLRGRISGAGRKRFIPRLQPAFQILPSQLAMAALLFMCAAMGIYLGNVLFEESLISFQGRQTGSAQEHVSLSSIKTFDTIPPGTLAHGYLKMVSYQEETH
jgi:anti-sigma factor RsiW